MAEYFGTTGWTILGVVVYGFAALTSKEMTFDWRLAAGALVFAFILDVVSSYISIQFDKMQAERSR